jgi:hypothetical protein
MSEEKRPLIDIINLSDEDLKKLKSGVLKRVLSASSKERQITSNLEETSHSRHSSVHSKD